MSALAHVVGFADPSGELVVQLLGGADPELVHEQALRVGRRAQDPRVVVDDPLQIQVSGRWVTK
jgi:hypothetical protein